MDLVWALLVFNCCFFLNCASEDPLDKGKKSTEHRDDEKKAFEVQLFPSNSSYPGRTRMPRTFFKKLHSGVAFLTGLKLGAVLSKKGFELGHGKIASSHSFQIFGKSVNSAMSLAYGNEGSLLPLVDDVPESEGSEPSRRTALKKENEKVFQVTVVEKPFNETMKKLQALSSQADEEISNEVVQNGTEESVNENVVLLYQDSVEEEPEVKTKSNFFEEHNKRVKELNENILRRKNSKF